MRTASRSMVFVLALAVGSVQSAAGAAPQVETFRFAAGPSVVLRLDTFSGAIKVETDHQPEVRVEVIATEPAGDTPVARPRVENVRTATEVQASGEIRVTVRLEDRSPRWSLQSLPPVEVAVRVIVPTTCALDLTTAEGEIQLGELAGTARVSTGRGLIFCRQAGERLEAVTGAGDIVVSRAKGDVTLRTEQGSIRVGSVHGRAELINRSGNVEVLVARGGLLAKAEAGDIEAGFPRNLSGTNHLETSGGSIALAFDPESSVRLEASSVWGKVTSKLPFQTVAGKLASRRFTGILNTGEVTVSARADGGHVRVQSRPDPHLSTPVN